MRLLFHKGAQRLNFSSLARPPPTDSRREAPAIKPINVGRIAIIRELLRGVQRPANRLLVVTWR